MKLSRLKLGVLSVVVTTISANFLALGHFLLGDPGFIVLEDSGSHGTKLVEYRPDLV